MNVAQRFAAVLLLVGLLGGCAAGAADIDPNASTQMQGAVRAIAVTAADGDYPAAVVKLDALQSRLDQSLAAGQVGRAPALQIQAAIDQVRTDLAALVQASAPAPASPSPRATLPRPDNGRPTGENGKPTDKHKD